IHIATSLLLYLFVQTTLRLPCLHVHDEVYTGMAFFTALLWAVHPLQTESVTYIVQRMNSLAALFYLLSLVLYAQARLAEDQRKKWALFAGCILAGLLAVASKEIAATLPCFILLYEWYFFQDLRLSWIQRHRVLAAGIVVCLVALALVYLGI